MEYGEFEAQMRKDVLVRLDKDGLVVPDGGLVLVGKLVDQHTEQEVWLWRAQVTEGVQPWADGPYGYVTVTYIYNFWGDACSRGELADVIVFNSVDGYKAVDPAEEMFPAG